MIRMKGFTQRLQYPLIKEYTLNLIRVPIIDFNIFLNSGLLESLGIRFGFSFEPSFPYTPMSGVGTPCLAKGQFREN